MDVKFLGQNAQLSPPSDSVGDALIAAFGSGTYDNCLLLSAFISAGGVAGLRNAFEQLSPAPQLRITIGVDMEGTSKEALEALLDFASAHQQVSAHVFYRPATPIFHPKLYLFEAPQEAKMVVGSANLTPTGLFQNVEAAVLITLDRTVPSDEQFLLTTRQQLGGLYTGQDPNLQPLDAALIQELVDEGLVPTEAARRAARAQAAATTTTTTKGQGLIKTLFPPAQGLPGVPTTFRKAKPKPLAPAAGPAPAVPATIATPAAGAATPPTPTTPVLAPAPAPVTPLAPVPAGNRVLVWQKNKLPGSDVQIAQAGTNPTGGLRLTQARFTANGAPIDQTTYFRHVVFGAEQWQVVPSQGPSKPLVETVTVPFLITIGSQSLGTVPLELRHKPSGEAGQNNYTTLLSWGKLGDTIAKANLIGHTLSLYRTPGATPEFEIELT